MFQVVQVVQMVLVVRLISLDDMRLENIYLYISLSEPSNYQEKKRSHACDTGTDREEWKIVQYPGRPETAVDSIL